MESAEFSPDGKRVVTAGDNTARLWDSATGQEVALLKGHAAPVRGANFIKGSDRVLTASGDKTPRVLNVEPGR